MANLNVSSSSYTQLAYIPETEMGVTPVIGKGINLRVTGESLDQTVSKETSKELNATRQTAGMFLTDAQVAGGLNVELSAGEFDPLFEACLMGTWSTFGTNGELTAGSTVFAAPANTITVTNAKTKQQKKYDLLRTSNSFKVNLDGLSAGNYSFTVKELNSNSVYNSTFEVLEFDIEKQFVNPDWNKLNQLANQTSGKAYLANQVDVLVKKLMADESYKAIQKTLIKKSPLIDWVWLLVLIAISLATEWFVRKYNGLL